MKLQHSLLAAALFAVATPTAMAQSTADLTVTGTIVPGSCTLALTNGGDVDLGVIDLTTLSTTAVTPLPTKTVTVDIVCTAATKFATMATENRPGTAYTADVKNFGLGKTTDDNPIGYYQILANNATADAVAATTIASLNLTTWTIPAGGVTVQHGAGAKYTAVGSAASGPSTVTEANWDLVITPTIAPTDDLVLGGPESIDGSMTLDIVYL